MLRITEEPYGSEVAARLVAALHHEIGERSAADVAPADGPVA